MRDAGVPRSAREQSTYPDPPDACGREPVLEWGAGAGARRGAVGGNLEHPLAAARHLRHVLWTAKLVDQDVKRVFAEVQVFQLLTQGIARGLASVP